MSYKIIKKIEENKIFSVIDENNVGDFIDFLIKEKCSFNNMDIEGFEKELIKSNIKLDRNISLIEEIPYDSLLHNEIDLKNIILQEYNNNIEKAKLDFPDMFA
jgi:hypothetical protein